MTDSSKGERAEYPGPQTLIGKIKSHFRQGPPDLRLDLEGIAEAVGEHPRLVWLAVKNLVEQGWLAHDNPPPNVRKMVWMVRPEDRESARQAAKAAAAERTIKVLCVGGVLDGQWKVVAWPERYGFQAMRPMSLPKMISLEVDEREGPVTTGFPEMDRYRIIGPIHLFGTKGISVALDHDTLMDKYHGAEEAMMLKALLQRDVATEMGL